MKFKRQTLTLLVQALCIGGVVVQSMGHAANHAIQDQERSYQIGANTLGYVLSSFAVQSGVSFSYDSARLANQYSVGLQGKYKVDAGFNQILKGTPYQVKQQGNIYILVKTAKETKASAANNTTAQQPYSNALDTTDPADITTLATITIQAEDKKSKVNTTSMDREQISRFRGTGNGDVFSDMAGVQVNSLRNEAGAIDIGIRGMQGEGRVPVIIDGSLQSSHTFRGYQGESDRSYIDMDLISQIEVEKGASRAKFSVSGIGGVVKMRTLNVNDVLLPDRQAGVMLKGSFYNNNKTPAIPESEKAQGSYILRNKLPAGNFQNGAGTIAFAYRNDIVDLLAAYSKREVGNYFAGKHGVDYYQERDMAELSAGQEVVNTSYKSDSGIIKAGININDEQRVEVNMRRHIQKAGEVMAVYWVRGQVIDPNSPPWGYINGKYVRPQYLENTYSMPQWSLGSAAVNAFSSNYSYKPKNNSWIDLEVGVWHTNSKYRQHNGLGGIVGAMHGDQYWGSFQDNRTGINVENTSTINDLGIILNYGLTYDEQRMKPSDLFSKESARDGLRKEGSVFLNGDYRFNDFTLSLGSKWHKAEVEDYGKQDRGSLSATKPNLHPKNNTVRKFGDNIDWMAQLNYQLIDGVDVYGKVSSAYRSPSLFESTTSRQTFSYDPDLPITSENSRIIEFGFLGQRENLFTENDQLKFNLNYFRNQTNDFLTQAAIAKDIPTQWTSYTTSYTFANYEQVLFKGLELDLSYLHPLFFASLNGTLYQAPKICPATKDDCNEVGDSWSLISTRIPPRQILNVSVGKYFFENKLSIGARARYHSEKNNPKNWLAGTGVSGRAVTEISSETLVDLFASYKVNKNLDLSLNVDNLTNRYNFDPGTVIGMPIPGRTIKAGFEMRF